MHGTLPAVPAPRGGRRLPVPLRLALRALRGGLGGFGVFVACIALGVAAIAGIGSLSRSLTEGLAREGRTLLGGDMNFSLVHREASAAELAFLGREGAVSSVATMRTMAAAGDGRSALVEIKAVDRAYPAVGAVATEPSRGLADLTAPAGDAFGAVVDPALLARLDLKAGDRITIGSATLVIAATLVSEPDKIATGLGFGPRLLISEDALRATGLIQPGALVRWTYRLALPTGAGTDAAIERIAAAAAREFPEAGWEIRSRLNADPRFARSIERFGQFLTLVGLTALLVGGVGVANAIRAFVDRERDSIATLKSLGASGGRVVAIYLTEVMLIAGLAISIGLAIGAALPFGLDRAFGHLLPVALAPVLAWRELGLAATYGILTALAFALLPLGRAHDISVAGLFREAVEPTRAWPRRRYLVLMASSLVALVLVSVSTAADRKVALVFLVCAAGAFTLLRLVAAGLMAGARRLPRPRRPDVRLALANLHRPGALTPSIVLSLGLGITLLVALGIVDANLTRQLTSTLPEKAPSLFFLDIPSAETERFDALLERDAPGAKLERVPMMRGRIVELKGVPVAAIAAPESAAWVLEGDRGLTYSGTIPAGSTITDGEWWPAYYGGPPLVSFERDLARALGLSVGDAVTVNVLGRNLTARIANLRQVEWRSLGINFVMVFSPNAFAGAPHTHLAALTLAGGPDAAREAVLLREVARAFPSVTSIRVKDALDAVNDVVGRLVAAVRGASGIALLASLLVLGGALAAGHRARLYDAVVLKTLGATRARLIRAYAFEYGALGLATAVFGAVAGTLVGYVIVTRMMNLGFAFEPRGPLVAAALAVLVTIALGLFGTWRVLSQKPARYLRSL